MDFDFSPKHVFRIVKRNWWAIMIAVILCTAAAIIATKELPVTYHSDTLILVKSEGLPDSYSKTTIDDSIQQRISNIKDMVLSRAQLSKIIKKYDLYYKEIERTSLENAIRIMRQSIKLKIAASVFQISYEGEDHPEKIMKVTDEVAGLFLEENLRLKQQIYSAYQFMEKKVRETQTNLQRLEEEIGKYKRDNVGQLPENLNANFTAHSNYVQMLNSTSRLLAKAEEEGRVMSKEFEAKVNDMIAKLTKRYQQKKSPQLTTRTADGEPLPPEIIEKEKEKAALEQKIKQLEDQLC